MLPRHGHQKLTPYSRAPQNQNGSSKARKDLILKARRKGFFPQNQTINRDAKIQTENSSTQSSRLKASGNLKQVFTYPEPFYHKLPIYPSLEQFGEDIYEGSLDERGRPEGYGKMYRQNGSVFIGCFSEGISNGEGHIIRTDGSYYHGNFKNNKANDENGFFRSKNIEYRGEVVDNIFHGKGKEIGKNHEFIGEYKDGRKEHGKLTWKQDKENFEYEGGFNPEGEFHGKGTLVQGDAGVYKGNFQNGEKHGKGQFTFVSGKKYIGEYVKGVKQGYGMTTNSKGEMIYEGMWKNGLPHGKGKAKTAEGIYMERTFIEGVDREFLSDDQTITDPSQR